MTYDAEKSFKAKLGDIAKEKKINYESSLLTGKGCFFSQPFLF